MRDRVTAEQTLADRVKVQRGLAEAWAELLPDYPKDRIHVEPSIEDTVRNIVTLKQKGVEGEDGAVVVPNVDVLVTGSLLLVGGMIEVAGLKEVAL